MLVYLIVEGEILYVNPEEADNDSGKKNLGERKSCFGSCTRRNVHVMSYVEATIKGLTLCVELPNQKCYCFYCILSLVYR